MRLIVSNTEPDSVISWTTTPYMHIAKGLFLCAEQSWHIEIIKKNADNVKWDQIWQDKARRYPEKKLSHAFEK